MLCVLVLCVLVCVAWQTDGATPLYAASQEGHVEVVRLLVGSGSAVNQARVREDWGVCWYLGVRGWLVFGSQHARPALCTCVCAWYLCGMHGVGDVRYSCNA